MRIRILNIPRNQVSVLVDEQPAGAVEVHKVVCRKILQSFYQDWLNYAARIIAEKNSRPYDETLDIEVKKSLLEFGQSLRGLLLPAELSFAGCRQVIFSTDAEWVRLPLELLPFDSTGNFIGIQLPVLRQIRTIEPVHTSPAKCSGKPQFLLMVNPEGAADVADFTERENQVLQQILGNEAEIRTVHRFSTFAKTLNALLAADYLHYSGHVRKQSLCLQSGALRPKDIAALQLKNLRLVFINGCESAAVHARQGLAAAFLAAGAQNFVGYNYPVSDASAQYAAEVFWQKFRRNRYDRQSNLRLPKALPLSIADISLAVRRALFEKFGAADLAWLGIQFFTAEDEPRTPLFKAAKWGFMAAAAIALLGLGAVFSAGKLVFLHWQEQPKSKEVQARTGSSVFGQPARVKYRDREYQTRPGNPADVFSQPKNRGWPNGLQDRLSGEYASPATTLAERVSAVSPALSAAIADFQTKEHPFYTDEEKEKILEAILDSPVSDAAKIIRIKNEIP